MIQDKDENYVEIKSVADIAPNNHYWLNPHTGRDEDWMVLRYGCDGTTERWVRYLKGENSLSLEDISIMSEAHNDLV